jgi:tetratricopeptide (TPR) repeat protein
MRRRVLPLLTVALAIAAPAMAQAPQNPATTDPPTAAELFHQGRAALEERNYEVACPKFAESQRLDPHVGTLVSLAQCEEATGHLARARGHWQQAIDLARTLVDSRQSVAQERFDQIDRRVPRIVLRGGADLPAEMVVRKDDVEVARMNLDAPLPVEVGKHTVTVSSPGFEASTTVVVLGEGETKEVPIALGPALPATPLPRAPPEMTVTPVPLHGKSPLRPVAIVAGGVGVVGIGIGSVLGLEAIAAKGQPAGVCDLTCNAQANARNAALREGDASTVAFIAGGALVAAGVVMWLVAPSGRSSGAGAGWWVAPAAAPNAASLGVGGTF